MPRVFTLPHTHENIYIPAINRVSKDTCESPHTCCKPTRALQRTKTLIHCERCIRTFAVLLHVIAYARYCPQLAIAL